MNKLGPFLKLVRLPNLIMILFVQYMVRFCFLYPTYKILGLSLHMNEGLFFLFSMAFLFMAAGGYVINDYWDVEIDKINKPERMVIGHGYTLAEAFELYWILSLMGVVIGFWSCYEMGLPSLGILFFIYMSGLWYYSTMFKYMRLLGNIIISIFLALVPFTAALVEIFADVRGHYFASVHSVPSIISYGVIIISVFAFLANFARELVKDAEDMEGDAKAGCKTVPIVFGIPATKTMVTVLLLCILAVLGYLIRFAMSADDALAIAYIVMAIVAPVFYILTLLYSADDPKGYHRVSNWLKLLMVSGISYLFVFAYTLLHSL